MRFIRLARRIWSCVGMDLDSCELQNDQRHKVKAISITVRPDWLVCCLILNRSDALALLNATTESELRETYAKSFG